MQLNNASDPKLMTLLQIWRTMLTDYEKYQRTDKLLVVNIAASYLSLLVKISLTVFFVDVMNGPHSPDSDIGGCGGKRGKKKKRRHRYKNYGISILLTPSSHQKKE